MEFQQVDAFLNWLTRNGSRLEYVTDGATRNFLLGGRALTAEEFHELAEEWLVDQGASVTGSGAALVVSVAIRFIAKGPRTWPPA